MAKSYYGINPIDYKPNGSRRPGAACDKVNSYVRNDDVSQRDRKNREIIIQKMRQYVEGGLKVEKAAAILANNPKVKKAFEYLANNGIDLQQLFENLYLSDEQRKNGNGRNNDIVIMRDR